MYVYVCVYVCEFVVNQNIYYTVFTFTSHHHHHLYTTLHYTTLQVKSQVIREQEALKLKARRAFHDDRADVDRFTGEVWLVDAVGSYLPHVYEEVLDKVSSYVLTENTALHVQALSDFVDKNNIARTAGSEWLVTSGDCETYMPHVYACVVDVVKITVMSEQQYCVVLNPYGEDGVQRMGQKELRQGPVQFFLKPGETLQGGQVCADACAFMYCFYMCVCECECVCSYVYTHYTTLCRWRTCCYWGRRRPFCCVASRVSPRSWSRGRPGRSARPNAGLARSG
jgi:hypothetical protein